MRTILLFSILTIVSCTMKTDSDIKNNELESENVNSLEKESRTLFMLTREILKNYYNDRTCFILTKKGSNNIVYSDSIKFNELQLDLYKHSNDKNIKRIIVSYSLDGVEIDPKFFSCDKDNNLFINGIHFNEETIIKVSRYDLMFDPPEQILSYYKSIVKLEEFQ